MAKINPITIRAASLTLSGTIATVVGTVSTDAANGTTGAFALGSLTALRIACNYARHVSSTTGRPRFEIDVSMDAPQSSAGSVANFVPVQLLDSGSFSTGDIDGYAMRASLAPSATGTTVHGIAPVDVRGAHWGRVRVLDVDGANPGAITALVFGGET
jgi:hypothetical protein